MKVLHINTHESQGGAARAAYRIHEALIKEGVESYFYVLFPGGGGKRTLYGKPESKAGRCYWKIHKAFELLYEQNVKKVVCVNQSVPISLGIASTLNREFISKFNPDVIHLHWICESFISIEDLKWLSRYPLVWTLHDSWAFTGGCHVPQTCRKWEVGCEKCELLGEKAGIDWAKKIFNKKRRAYAQADIKVIGVSEWLADCARRSVLFANKDVFCVHNTLNQDIYKPKKKSAVRNILGLPQDKKVILFGAMSSTSDENKGFKFLHEAICHLVQDNLDYNFELMVFGSDEPDSPPEFGVPVHYMGKFSDDISLSMLYSAADIMIVPSRSEAFPNTVLESINCGTPVAAFRIGGIPDQIDHKVNGYLAEPYDSKDLARGIAYILEDEERWQQMSKAARRKAEDCFNEKRIAQEYIKVYHAARAKKFNI